MQPYEYTTMHRYEDHYWWYTGLRRILALTFKKLPRSGTEVTLLDAGCGTGGTLACLAQTLGSAKLFAIDVYPPALHLTRLRKTGAVLLQASVNQVPFQKNVFDVITCFDVACIQGVNDLETFREFHRTLKPGGVLLINLPAYHFLRGEHDIAVHTRHRYTASELGWKLKSAGFSIKRLTYWNALLFPFLLVMRKISTWKKKSDLPQSDFRLLPPWVNRLLKIILRIEEMFISILDLPFGTSIFAVARKN